VDYNQLTKRLHVLIFEGTPPEKLNVLIDEYAGTPEERLQISDVIEDLHVEYILACQARAKIRDRMIIGAIISVLCGLITVYMIFSMHRVSLWLILGMFIGGSVFLQAFIKLQQPVEHFAPGRSQFKWKRNYR
jgi:hypothetical protein